MRLVPDELVNAVRFPHHRRSLENGEIVFTYLGPSREIVMIFWRALRRLQTGLPEQEFTKRWRAPFPTKDIDALTAAVERSGARASVAGETVGESEGQSPSETLVAGAGFEPATFGL